MRTTVTMSHDHRVYVDDDGWGETDHVWTPEGMRHCHRIDAWDVVIAAGHSHEIERPRSASDEADAARRGPREEVSE